MFERIQFKTSTLIILIKVLILVVGIIGLQQKKTWNYELKSISSNSSDPEKFEVQLEIERISRGVYAMSGFFSINIDITEGDINHLAAKAYRSARGDDDYKILPYQMPRTQFIEFLNTYYKDALMSTMAKCSDLPAFEDKFQPPFEKKKYVLDKCEISQDGFPNHLSDGFYKVVFLGTGEVEWLLEVVVEITSAL